MPGPGFASRNQAWKCHVDPPRTGNRSDVRSTRRTSSFFFASDGGVFRTNDGGGSFVGLNGGYTTTQFYNGFSNAAADSLLAMGGMQDNFTAIWEGSPAWRRGWR